ncbi:MAG: glycolate oxidase subunit GlcD [Deltaproteobacteria bacterium RIFCSPLOWO2_02_FULL_53_8]|nr:MAG: glycolate oxidase subunit GlcD [Deltaproteobacteria bacterium RIFCSPLOWO2_02_FULL_53_8]
MITDRVKRELERLVGTANASFLKEDLICYSYDATNSPHLPDAVVFPATAQEVSGILRLANAESFPVIPRGAGSGFTGGSLPVDGGVVVSTERMKAIISIDTENLTAVVEPGVVTWDFQQEVERQGLFYPPDPSSLKFSTIGGNIAECAGGPRAVKYGVTRDYVLGLEVVLPTGEIVQTGVVTAKGVVGYDLTRLLVGSEGTLGIVTKAVLRLIPLPEHSVTLQAVFPALRDAAAAVSCIIKAKIIPSTLEMVDSVSTRCVEEYVNIGLPRQGSFLLIEADGARDAVVSDIERIKRICLDNGATGVAEAADKKAVKDLWKARRSISAALLRIKPDKLNEDVVVPRSKMVELITGIEDIAAARGLLIACFGHAGDGNVHVNIMHDKRNPLEAASAHAAVTDVFALTLKLGGTISGEHGVGVTKAPYLAMELSQPLIDTMKAIKKTLDPNGILNPGKIFMRQDGYESIKRP